MTRTALEAQTLASVAELSAALGLPTYQPDVVAYRWACAVCRSGEADGYRSFVLVASSAPIRFGCEVCNVRDPLAQVEAVRARNRIAELEAMVAELHEVSVAQARLLDRRNAQVAQLSGHERHLRAVAA